MVTSLLVPPQAMTPMWLQARVYFLGHCAPPASSMGHGVRSLFWKHGIQSSCSALPSLAIPLRWALLVALVLLDSYPRGSAFGLVPC